MSIRIVANSFLKKGSEEGFLALAKELVEKTNALDEGCISYQLCQNVDDPAHVAMIEEWADRESLDAHMKAAHFQKIIPQLGQFTDREDVIQIFKKVF